MQKETGFTGIAIITVFIIFGILGVTGYAKYLELQTDVAKENFKAAKAELDLRECIAWARYKTYQLSWAGLVNPDTITGGTSGFGKYKVENGRLKAPGLFKMSVDIKRNLPTKSRPGTWVLGKYHK
jgi:type II secretory pathway pseudopilin PulG